MLPTVLKEAVSVYKKHGFGMLLLEVFRNRRWPVSLFAYARQEILLAYSDKLLPKRLLDTGYEVKVAGENDINAIIELMREDGGVSVDQYQYKYNKLLGFVKDRNSLYIVYDKQQVVGMLYLYRREREMHLSDFSGENRLFLTGGDDTSFFGYGYVALKYRMKGVFPLLVDHVVRFNPSTKMYVSDVSPLNMISLNSVRRIGFSVVGNVMLFRVFTILSFWRVCINNRIFYRFGKNIHLAADSLISHSE